MNRIKYILFDVANTLISKPLLWDKLEKTLNGCGFIVSKEKLQVHHKMISEQTDFPDRTDKVFYAQFNTHLLHSLGICANDDLLERIFQECSYLPWQAFEDTSFLKNTTVPVGILSNFRKELPELLHSIFEYDFRNIIVSEKENLRKPDVRFFEFAIEQIGLCPYEILYVGDSLKLDYIPARQAGFNTLLIDRIEIYCSADYIINNLNQLNQFIK